MRGIEIPDDGGDACMTLAELKALNTEMLTPAQVAAVTGQHPQYIRIQARENPKLLGYPVSVCGTRTRIPKAGFIRWMEGN